MIERWKVHVESWTHCVNQHAGLVVVRYEDLATDFEATLSGIGERMAMPCPNPTRPEVDQNVVSPGKGEVGGYRDLLTADDHAYIEDVIDGVRDAMASAVNASGT